MPLVAHFKAFLSYIFTSFVHGFASMTVWIYYVSVFLHFACLDRGKLHDMASDTGGPWIFAYIPGCFWVLSNAVFAGTARTVETQEIEQQKVWVGRISSKVRFLQKSVLFQFFKII